MYAQANPWQAARFLQEMKSRDKEQSRALVCRFHTWCAQADASGSNGHDIASIVRLDKGAGNVVMRHFYLCDPGKGVWRPPSKPPLGVRVDFVFIIYRCLPGFATDSNAWAGEVKMREGIDEQAALTALRLSQVDFFCGVKQCSNCVQ
jgi:hypothetical protein